MGRRGRKIIKKVITNMNEPAYDIHSDYYKIGVIKKPKRQKEKLSYLPYTGKWTTRLMQKKERSKRR